MKAALSIAVKDDFDRLLKVSTANGSGPTSTLKELNRYDVNGIRKRKMDKNSNSSTEYTAGISTTASEAASSGSTAPTISYIMGHQILGAEVNGNFQFFLTDALGTVRDIVDDSGAVVQSYEFDPHGNPMPGSGAGSVISAKTFHGALSVNDDTADSGLYLMGHRHWDPTLSRFISRDPIGFRGGLNLYGAAFGNNPLTFADPSGLEPTLTPGEGPPLYNMTFRVDPCSHGKGGMDLEVTFRSQSGAITTGVITTSARGAGMLPSGPLLEPDYLQLFVPGFTSQGMSGPVETPFLVVPGIPQTIDYHIPNSELSTQRGRAQPRKNFDYVRVDCDVNATSFGPTTKSFPVEALDKGRKPNYYFDVYLHDTGVPTGQFQWFFK